ASCWPFWFVCAPFPWKGASLDRFELLSSNAPDSANGPCPSRAESKDSSLLAYRHTPPQVVLGVPDVTVFTLTQIMGRGRPIGDANIEAAARQKCGRRKIRSGWWCGGCLRQSRKWWAGLLMAEVC